MKHRINRIFVTFGIVITCAFVVLYARVRPAQSERDFEQHLSKERLVVVMFYKKNKKDPQYKELQDAYNRLEHTFEMVSNKAVYKDAGVAFIKANAARGDLEKSAYDYGITEFPAFVLFNNDVIVTDSNGNIAMLTGFVKRSELKEFIEDNCKDSIKKALDTKEALLRRRKAAAAAAWVPYYYPYDYYQPYYDYYWHRPIYYPGAGIGIRYHRHWR